MEIKGYKAFALDGKDLTGKTMPPGKYHSDGAIRFDKDGNGFIFCKNIEDTFKFGVFSPKPTDALIAEVVGSGEMDEGFDYEYGYFGMYRASDLEVLRYLSRDEIIALALELPEERMARFVSMFQLTAEEINTFYGHYGLVDLALDYYQKHMPCEEVYSSENKYKKVKEYQRPRKMEVEEANNE